MIPKDILNINIRINTWCYAWTVEVRTNTYITASAIIRACAFFFLDAFCQVITRTYLYNFDPLKPHFYIVKLRVGRGIHYFSYFCSKNIDCGYSLEPPRRGGSNGYPQSMFWAELLKISEFLSENLVENFSVYLNRHAFVKENNRCIDNEQF